MNLKKALQAFLVTVSCGVLNIAGAQQRPVFIPEDYCRAGAGGFCRQWTEAAFQRQSGNCL